MKLLKLCLSFLLTVGLCSCSAGTTASSKGIVILFTNDVHGRVLEDLDEPSWGDARIAKEKEDLISEGYDTYLFSAGDDIQGEPIVNNDEGTSAIQFMNETGYDAMAVGNHEFDWGYENILKLQDTATFPLLSANVQYTDSGESLFTDHTIFTTEDGKKIGVFGLTTPSTYTTTNPNNVEGISFLKEDEFYSCAQEQIDILKNDEKCDYIICLGHMGINDSDLPNCSKDVIENTKGIDIFIDGHSHSEINEKVNDTLLVQTGQYGHNLGKIMIDASGNITAVLLPAINQDEDVLNSINDVNDAVQEELSSVFASSTVELVGERALVRTQETNLGDLTCDAILWSAAESTGKEIDAAIINGGGIRASISAGDITYLTMKTVFPFGNTITVVEVTGEQLLEAFEAATASLPDPVGAFPQVSNIIYTVDTSIAYQGSEDYPDTTIASPAAPGSRVTIASINGKEFSKEDTYTIATNDFITSGGDAYYVFKEPFTASGIDTGVTLEDGLVNYFTSQLNNVIGDSYSSTDGRITILP